MYLKTFFFYLLQQNVNNYASIDPNTNNQYWPMLTHRLNFTGF